MRSHREGHTLLPRETPRGNTALPRGTPREHRSATGNTSREHRLAAGRTAWEHGFATGNAAWEHRFASGKTAWEQCFATRNAARAHRFATRNAARTPLRHGNAAREHRFAAGNTAWERRFATGNTAWEYRFAMGNTAREHRFATGNPARIRCNWQPRRPAHAEHCRARGSSECGSADNGVPPLQPTWIRRRRRCPAATTHLDSARISAFFWIIFRLFLDSNQNIFIYFFPCGSVPVRLAVEYFWILFRIFSGPGWILGFVRILFTFFSDYFPCESEDGRRGAIWIRRRPHIPGSTAMLLRSRTPTFRGPRRHEVGMARAKECTCAASAPRFAACNVQGMPNSFHTTSCQCNRS